MSEKAWGGSHWIRREKRLALYIRDSFQCAYCGTSLKDSSPDNVTLDHLVARHHGGGNEATNLITACKPCNSGRGCKPWADYCSRGACDRIETLRNSPLNLPLSKVLINGTAGDAEVEALR